ncbi:helix-turn-helix transcriptional regulator [Microbacterium testaceum]|uniref:helix-turn-helix transcriptional regulator n=1 Tax=Microbacterium testaceum TaxID=2033 RepID=UPI000734A3AF|nr:transcriptional regulator [Microbacterium testaceum]
MPEYELTFELPRISEDVEELIMDRFDAVIAEHQGVVTATLTVDGADCVSSARAAMDVLAGYGAEPRRLIDDLVTRSQIAERLGVSRQAVGLWISAQRQASIEFPPPFVLAGGGLWRWAEVVPFARALGYELDEIKLPTRRETQLIGGILAARSDASTGTFITAMIERLAVSTSEEKTPAFAISVAANARVTDFSLAA